MLKGRDFIQGYFIFLLSSSHSSFLGIFLFFSGLATVLNLIFVHSLRKCWHHDGHICLEGLFNNA